MNVFRSLCLASFFAAAMAGPGCGGNEEPDVVDHGKTISSVEITTGITTLTMGSSIQLRAVVKYADGTSMDVTSNDDTTWNTSDPKVATVDNKGHVTAVEVGTVDVTITYKGVKGSESFIVTPQ